MQNNLTEKDIENLNKWAEKCGISSIGKDKEEIFNIKKLYFSTINSIEHIPFEISKLINLEEIFINCQGLIISPEDVKNLVNIKKLDIYDVKLKYIPAEIFTLTNIEELTISYRKLKKFPEDIKNLINLKSLTIYCENLIELPKEIGDLTSLEKLDISCDNLKLLPKEIYNLINLKRLNIYSDNLENFPDGIEKLINLENIYISNRNKTLNFKDLPMEGIGKLNNLKVFHFDRRNYEEWR